MSDLFGSDLPVEGVNGIKFEWRDGPFLKALRLGEWILLDEVSREKRRLREKNEEQKYNSWNISIIRSEREILIIFLSLYR